MDEPGFFFKNTAQSLFINYQCLTSCKESEKSLERSRKSDYKPTKPTRNSMTNGQGRLLKTPSGKLGVQNTITLVWSGISKVNVSRKVCICKTYLKVSKKTLDPLNPYAQYDYPYKLSAMGISREVIAFNSKTFSSRSGCF